MISFKGTLASSLRDRPVSGKIAAFPRRKTIFIRPKPGNPLQGLLHIGHQHYICALGRTGITSIKKEGDGATPRATMRILMGFWREGRMKRPNVSLPILKSETHFGWCDETKNPYYNRPIALPSRASHETMQRHDRLYDCVIVLDWNIAPKTGGRQRNKGSAIFLHVAKEGHQPTEGCIALTPKDLRHLLPRLSQKSQIKVI